MMHFNGYQIECGINTVAEEMLDSLRLAGCDSEQVDTVRDALTNNWDALLDAFYISANRKVDEAISP
jgi:hypothetical protein